MYMYVYVNKKIFWPVLSITELYIYIYITELSHNAGAALSKQVRAVWIVTLQKKSQNLNSLFHRKGRQVVRRKYSKIRHNYKETR